MNAQRDRDKSRFSHRTKEYAGHPAAILNDFHFLVGADNDLSQRGHVLQVAPNSAGLGGNYVDG